MTASEEEDVLLERVLDAAQGGVGRSPLYVWMWQQHDRLKGAFNRPDWKKMAAEFEAAGINAANGEPPTPTTVRQTWWKVRRDKQGMASERRQKLAEAKAAAKGAEPPPKSDPLSPVPVADAQPDAGMPEDRSQPRPNFRGFTERPGNGPGDGDEAPEPFELPPATRPRKHEKGSQ